MKFFLVVMFVWISPPPDGATNAIRISEKDGNPLYFENREDCFNHASQNFLELHTVIPTVYDGAKGIITDIICMSEEGITT